VGWWRLIQVEGRRDEESDAAGAQEAAQEPAT
jgi:hypothetical protein